MPATRSATDLPNPGFALATLYLSGQPPFPALVARGKYVPIHALKPLLDRQGCKVIGGRSVLELLENWEDSFDVLRRVGDFFQTDAAKEAPWGDLFVPIEQLRFRPPVDLPRQVFCAGANYRKHVIDLIVDQGVTTDGNLSREERRAQAAKMMDERAAHGAPFVFSKPPSAITGPYDPVILPTHAAQPDWELELAAIIGKPCRHVDRDRALDYVAGYTIVNDVTNRELVFRKDAAAMGADWLAAKGAPSYLPMGPYLIPTAFIDDPQNLQITLKLNGELMQNESTADMVFDVARIIEFLSGHV